MIPTHLTLLSLILTMKENIHLIQIFLTIDNTYVPPNNSSEHDFSSYHEIPILVFPITTNSLCGVIWNWVKDVNNFMGMHQLVPLLKW